MAIERNGELVLDRDESMAFIARMLHPDREAMRLRDVFLRDLDDADVVFSDGEISVDLPSLSLPAHKRSVYDNVPMNGSEHFASTVYFEQKNEFPMLSSLFSANTRHNCSVRYEKETWAFSADIHQQTFNTAA